MNIVEYTEYLVKSICKDEEMVKVSSYAGDDKTIVDVLVPENMMGAVLGRQGRNIESIRILVNAYAYLHELGKIDLNVDSF